MPLEGGLDDAALHAGAAAVNQPHLAQAGLVRGLDVLLDDRPDVARMEGVEVERAFYGDVVGVAVIIYHCSWGPTPTRCGSTRYARSPRPQALPSPAHGFW